ncbi:unnamed protein product, partial [Dicrocoelium dendriticum]
MSDHLKENICRHLASLENALLRYFPHLTEGECALVRDPFSTSLHVANTSDDVQDECLDMQYNYMSRD